MCACDVCEWTYLACHANRLVNNKWGAAYKVNTKLAMEPGVTMVFSRTARVVQSRSFYSLLDSRLVKTRYARALHGQLLVGSEKRL